jgi:hypothetical protein
VGEPLTDICTIDEAEEVKERNCWDNIQVDLPQQFALGDRIEMDERVAISEGASQ